MARLGIEPRLPEYIPGTLDARPPRNTLNRIFPLVLYFLRVLSTFYTFYTLSPVSVLFQSTQTSHALYFRPRLL